MGGNLDESRHRRRRSRADRLLLRQCFSTSSVNVRAVPGSVESLQQELPRKDVQDRVRHLHQRLQEIAERNL